MHTPPRFCERRAFVAWVCSAMLLSACARTAAAPRSLASTSAPQAAHSVFVGPFTGEFARELRAAVHAELEKTPRYRMVETEEDADYVLSGVVSINTRLTNGTLPLAPVGIVQLLSRASGLNVWQYTYRDQRTGAEFVVPTPGQQVSAVARQFVAQLLNASIWSAKGEKAQF
jgi:hypothetical protein